MIICSPEPRVKILVDPEVKILVDRDLIKISFEQWAKPGHFSRTIVKGHDTTTWIWNLHADAHDFDSHTSDLEEISRKVFSIHFGQLSIIFLWLSGMYFHGARFSNYEAVLVVLIFLIIRLFNPSDNFLLVISIHPKVGGSVFSILVLYIENILFATNNFGLLHENKKIPFNNFKIRYELE